MSNNSFIGMGLSPLGSDLGLMLSNLGLQSSDPLADLFRSAHSLQFPSPMISFLVELKPILAPARQVCKLRLAHLKELSG